MKIVILRIDPEISQNFILISKPHLDQKSAWEEKEKSSRNKNCIDQNLKKLAFQKKQKPFIFLKERRYIYSRSSI